MTRVRPWRVAGRLLALGCALAGTVVFDSAALAQPAQRVGWWSMLSAGGLSAPAPTTPSGGLRVAAAPGQVIAYGAVLYAVPGPGAARLVLVVADSQGNVALQACPTTGSSWPAGGDQPAAVAPSYDCAVEHYPGIVSADDTTITFVLPGFTTRTPGQLSLAILPSGSASAPFSVDVDKPGPGSLTLTQAPKAAAAAPPAGPVPPPVTSAAAAPTPVAAGQPLGVPAPPAPLPQPAQAAAPVVAGPAPDVAPGPTPAAVAVTTRAVGAGSAPSAGEIFGGAALVAALLFWGLGYGLLGGRITPLSVPLRSAEAVGRTPSESTL